MPKGWEHIRGCMGTNDDENTVCQRKINKEIYLAKNIKCPYSQFYSKDKISKKIDEMNRELQKRDEIVRTQLTNQNNKIKQNPKLLMKNKLINLNDPKTFPNLYQID